MSNLLSLNLVVALIILIPLVKQDTRDYTLFAKNMVKYAFFVSLLPLISLSSQTQEASTGHKEWMDFFFTNMSLSFSYDPYAVIFLPVALFVTWSILEFSTWYMHDDPDKDRFFKYLLTFLLAMVILATAGNFFMFFIGWEGVGIMSFLLIGWYHARNSAAAAAFQAVLYNRVGDIGFLASFCWLLKKVPSMDWLAALTVAPPTIILFGLITAAATKSAQFMFHPWLASAMEGPTPVSALLHSSTMVVAGIFLLIRVSPFLGNNQTALTICLCLGALTTFYAATLALTQNDIKKIVAYSTSSQLGLMMVAIGIGLPHLAFFHICTHAFFKAMLFLCSGAIIHNLDDEQDIRKMGGLQLAMPVTTTCFSVGSFALMGTPFLAGFYSKDAIIEAANLSYVNSAALAMTLVATAFTAVYSLRLIFYISLNSPRTNPVLKFDENSLPVLNAISRLALGSVVAGLFIFHMTFPHTPAIHTMPLIFKTAAIVLTVIGFVVAYDLATTTWHTTPAGHAKSKLYDPLHYNQVMQRPIITATLDTGWKVTSHLLDSILIKKFSPGLMKESNFTPIKIVRASQSGLIKAYLSTLFITMFFVMIILHFLCP
uniref:NADH-ubiquinone oxidoreductase chain 5 n=1 Tax=Aglyptodactylus madagascariensis TaxID=68424 RepID=B2DC94_9NEOB|nr:NADH dehydrogenase subunit 5 [Aglyptodactylus madagascariensis]